MANAFFWGCHEMISSSTPVKKTVLYDAQATQPAFDSMWVLRGSAGREGGELSVFLHHEPRRMSPPGGAYLLLGNKLPEQLLSDVSRQSLVARAAGQAVL